MGNKAKPQIVAAIRSRIEDRKGAKIRNELIHREQNDSSNGENSLNQSLQPVKHDHRMQATTNYGVAFPVSLNWIGMQEHMQTSRRLPGSRFSPPIFVSPQDHKNRQPFQN
jgi:hypothetical protein